MTAIKPKNAITAAVHQPPLMKVQGIAMNPDPVHALMRKAMPSDRVSSFSILKFAMLGKTDALILTDLFTLLSSASSEIDCRISESVLDRCGAIVCGGGRNAVIAYGMATVFMPMCQNVFPRIVLRGPMLGILLYKWKDIYMWGGRQNLYFKCKGMLKDIEKSNASEKFRQKTTQTYHKHSQSKGKNPNQQIQRLIPETFQCVCCDAVLAFIEAHV